MFDSKIRRSRSTEDGLLLNPIGTIVSFKDLLVVTRSNGCVVSPLSNQGASTPQVVC
jgi:hypothetical protein